jgi:uncharacterized protein YecA (UPF0149 family)
MKLLERLFNNKKADAKKAEPGRNEVCWCGSGKKYKRCHLGKDEEKKRMNNALGRKGK